MRLTLARMVSLRERLELKVDRELGSTGVLAFIGTSGELAQLEEELRKEKLLKKPTELIGPYAPSPLSTPLYRLKIDPSDIDAIVGYGITGAMVAKINRKNAASAELASSQPTHVIHVAESPVEAEISEKRRQAIDTLNSLTWIKVSGGIKGEVDHLSPINLVELIKPFPISGLYETGTDNRNMTRTLTLFDRAIETLEPYGFTGHKTGQAAASAQTTNVSSPRIKNEAKRREALKELNRVDEIGQYIYRWKRSPHRDKGIQLDYAFSTKEAAEAFRDLYLIDAGARETIIEPTAKEGKGSVTGISGIQHSTRTWQIALALNDITRLAETPEVKQIRDLFTEMFPNVTFYPKGGYKGRG